MTLEEKRNVIINYCTERTCHRCALKNRPFGSCYSDTRDAVIETNYKLIMEDMNKSDNAEVKEKLIKAGDRGSMVVKGTCYDYGDVLDILCRNGYKTTMITEPSKEESDNIEHKIVFWKEPVSDNSYQE